MNLSTEDLKELGNIADTKIQEISQDTFPEDYFAENMRLSLRLESDTSSVVESYIGLLSYLQRTDPLGYGLDEDDPQLEYLSEIYMEDPKKIVSQALWVSLDQMPALVNSPSVFERIVSIWRLKIGK